MRQEPAIFYILIADFVAQIISIFLLSLVQILVDLGRTKTDLLGERRYKVKVVLLLMTITLSNWILTKYISRKSQFVNTYTSSQTSKIDESLIFMFGLLLVYLIILNAFYGIQKLEDILKQKVAKYLSILMMWLVFFKISMFIFGNLYMIANLMRRESVP